MKRRYLALLALLPLIALAVPPAWPADDSPEALAAEIIEESGVIGGVVVHVGCGDGTLTAALRRSPSYIVHGLDASAKQVTKARAHIDSLGLYGPVSVEQWRSSKLPYADNTVNLLVSTEKSDVPADEMLRVLVPDGVAYVRSGDSWEKTVKPRPGNTDEWTHYMHDAGGNAVAHDEVVGPPGLLQWTAQPPFARSHEHVPSIFAVVSASGRIFYIADQAPISSVRAPAVWRLVARDAYNGTLLWERPVARWYPHIINWGQTPTQLQRRLVAVGDRVYGTLGLLLPVCAVDAATGETVQTYQGTEGAEEIILHEGVLLIVTRRITDERLAELKSIETLALEDGSPLYKREDADALVKNFRRTDNQAQVALLAVDAETGELLWKKEGPNLGGFRSMSLCAEGDSAYYFGNGTVKCLDLRSGDERWTTPSTRLRLVYQGTAICANNETVAALSAETGDVLWTQKPLLTDTKDCFIAGGSVWIGGGKPWEPPKPSKYSGPAWGPYFAVERDPKTGEVVQEITQENPLHHHRCYSNKATDRYILGGRRGTEFLDLEAGEVLWHSWARGVCRYGVMPANGLLYAPPHACGCYASAKLIGFNALAPLALGVDPPTGEPPAVERGPAYGTRRSAPASPADWPTYRADPKRSGRTSVAVPTELKPLWETDLGGTLTAPTIAGGKVLIASIDEHSVRAIDADSGDPAWRFVAGGRVDSAPTIHNGRAVFGCRDGYVYNLRARDGALAWRLRAARAERRIAANGQLESVSPVVGSVLVRDDVLYCTSGRSSYLDGGIDLCRIDPITGEALSRTSVYSPDPQTGRQPAQSAPAFMPGARSDVLSSDADHIYLRETTFDTEGVELPEGKPHLFTVTGFLDGTWTHRSYWIFGTKLSMAGGCSGRTRDLNYGRLLVFDDSTVYGYGRKSVHWSNQLQDGPYRLFARGRDADQPTWETPVPLQVRAMLMAGDVLFVAGPRANVHDLPGETEGALLMAFSTADGAQLAKLDLDSEPVFDGMAAANGKLYIATTDGRIFCLG